MSDHYMHCEKELMLTRKCLEIILKYGFGAAVQTKSDLILRDIDLLDEINRKSKCVVQMTRSSEYNEGQGDTDCGVADTDTSVYQ